MTPQAKEAIPAVAARTGQALQEALGLLAGNVINGATYTGLAEVFGDKAGANAENVLGAINQAAEHGVRTAATLAESIGELSLYVADVSGRPGHVQDRAREGDMPAGIEAGPADPLALDYPHEELLALLEDGQYRRVQNTVQANKIFRIPGRPDLLLRAAPAWLTMGKISTPEQRESHKDHYWAELRRLHDTGIPVLRQAIHIVHSPMPNRSMVYTVVEHHPNAAVNLKEHLKRFEITPGIERTVLSTVQSLLQYYTTGQKVLWDIDRPLQYATDGTLLDYDTYLTTAPLDIFDAIMNLRGWLKSLSDTPQKTGLLQAIELAGRKLESNL